MSSEERMKIAEKMLQEIEKDIINKDDSRNAFSQRVTKEEFEDGVNHDFKRNIEGDGGSDSKAGPQ